MQENRSEVEYIMWSAMAKGGNTMTNKNNVYAALKARYSSRDWFVIVYDYNKDYFKLNDGEARAPDSEHYFEPSFYRIKYNGKDAAAMSFPTNNNKEKASLNSQTISAVNSYNCAKGNQQSARDVVNGMRNQIKSVCPNCNIGAVPKMWCSPCHYITVKWHECSWQAYTFGSLVDGRQKSCDNKENENPGNLSNGYQPFAIFVLPPTRPYTVPESEQVIKY